MEKEPSRRYESTNDFALDLQRHLDREPVQAYPPSRWYLTTRFVSKYRWSVAGVSLVMVTFVAATVISTLLYLNEQHARRRADQESNRSNQVVKILSDMISAAGPSVSQGRDPGLMKDILAETKRRIDGELKEQPEIELEIRRLLARAYADIGEFQLSHELYQRVVELEESLHSSDLTRLAATYAELSESLEVIDRLEEAEKLLRKAIQIREALVPKPTKDIAKDRELLAWMLGRRGDLSASEQQARKALADYPQNDKGFKKFRGQALMTLGYSLLKTAQFKESESVHREALVLYRDHYTKPHPDLVTAINNLCHLLVEIGKFDEVETLAKEGLKMQELLDGKPIGSCTDALNKALASVYSSRGEFDKAIECLEYAIRAASEVYGADHRFTNDKRSLLAQMQIQAQRIDDAEQTLKVAKEVGGAGESADNSLAIAEGLLALAKNDLDRAQQIADQEYQRKKADSLLPSTGQIEAALLLADIHLARKEYDQADKLLAECLAILRPDINIDSVLLQSVRTRQTAVESAKLSR